ncbi:MAG: hypothetical protein IJU71_00490, partial [Selenomonadaceae bacterium]|nr:hypothetical protein [Selenomonadaceae bacterium]
MVIGGSVTVNATANSGAGIGSGYGTNAKIGAITIGGTATVTATSENGAGIGKGFLGSAGTVTYGKGATVTNNGTAITDAHKSDNVTADSLTAQTEPQIVEVYDWTDLTDGAATYYKLTKTAGYALDTNKKTLTYTAAEGTDQFTLTGVKTTEGITVKDGVVTVNAANLVDEPTVGTTVTLNVANGVTTDYTLALADDVPQAEAAGTPTTMSGTNYTISADGVYQFAEGFTGTVTIASGATNVKIIGAGSKLSNVSIDASAVSGINLWIQDLVISTDRDANLIKFGSGDNYLTVKGTNTLTDSAMGVSYDQALINVGSGTLNIIGDGTLNAQQTSESTYGAAIGSDFLRT